MVAGRIAGVVLLMGMVWCAACGLAGAQSSAASGTSGVVSTGDQSADRTMNQNPHQQSAHSGSAVDRSNRAALTNADVIRLVKARIGERTILLEIKGRPTRFDTSAQALVRLKKAGVSERILEAMIEASSQPVSAAEDGAASTETAQPLTGEEMIAKALNAIGPHEKLIGIHAIRWTVSVAQSVPDGPAGETQTFFEEGVRMYPGLQYVGMQRPSGEWEKVVVTPAFGYQSTREMTVALPAARARVYREEMKFDPVYVAQHLADYIFTPLGTEMKDGRAVDVLRISADGLDYTWRIDGQTGRLLEAQHQVASGEVTVRYGDYRAVDGLMLPFKRSVVTVDRATELTVTAYKVNPEMDGTLWLQPASLSQGALRLKVLDTESVSYTQDLGGGNSANCQMQASAGASGAGDSLDDMGFSREPGSNLKMICNSWDQNSILRRMLNAMLVASSDGNAYVIACDKAWHWSKCVPLQQGVIFHGSRSENKIDVQGINDNGKDVEAEYTILATKPLE
jgi:hypothetical protein